MQILKNTRRQAAPLSPSQRFFILLFFWWQKGQGGERELEGIMVRITGGLLATLSLAVLVHGVSAVEVGELAPAFELPDTMGENVSLADFRGNPVAVVFYRGRF